jgi:hypothetical protein
MAITKVQQRSPKWIIKFFAIFLYLMKLNYCYYLTTVNIRLDNVKVALSVDAGAHKSTHV